MPFRVRKLLARLGRQIGYQVYPQYMDAGRPMAQRLGELFALCGITQVIDVGANRGQFRDFLRFDMDYTGPILSFEPDPDLAAKAREHARASGDSGWRIRECALGRSAGRAQFNRMQQTAYNSFRTPLASAAETEPENRIVAQFEVEVCRLDEMIAELGDLAHCFVKIDTQGFDLEVLAGGTEALRRVPLLQTEVSFRSIYDGTPDWMSSIKAFQDQGFCFADIFNIRESCRGGLPIEGDCIMMRPR